MQALRLLVLCIAILTLLFTGIRCLLVFQESGELPFDALYPFLVSISSFLLWFFLPADASRSAGPVIAQHDVDLFAEFQQALPFDPTIQTLEQADFGADYLTEWLRPLHEFASNWNNPNREFLDQELEAARRTLVSSAESLSWDFARETVPNDGNPGWTTVYPWNQRGGPRPAHVIESARVLNEASRKFIPIYKDFVRLANRKLARPAKV